MHIVIELDETLTVSAHITEISGSHRSAVPRTTRHRRHRRQLPRRTARTMHLLQTAPPSRSTAPRTDNVARLLDAQPSLRRSELNAQLRGV